MKYFVNVLLYLTAIAIGVAFALFLSAPIGWTFVYMLVCAPVFSLGITFFLTRGKRVSVTSDVDNTMLYKGEFVTLRIIVRNKSVFPVPAVKVKLSAQGGLVPENSCENYVVSVSPRSESVIEIKYKAKVWGRYILGAENIYMHDFIGFFKFRMSCLDSVNEIRVFPDIPEIQGDSPLLRSAAEAARFADDSEETTESECVTGFSGMPGYTHREYVEGDPVRRINWKLSSKRDKYMIRLDDEVESIKQNIVLDNVGGNNIYENERAVEGMLAAALELLKCGFESTVYCCFNNVYEGFAIAEPGDVSALQTRLADFSFERQLSAKKKNSRIPIDEMLSSGGSRAMMVYTSLFDNRLSTEISSAEEQGITCAVVTSDSSFSGSSERLWRINEDYSAELLS